MFDEIKIDKARTGLGPAKASQCALLSAALVLSANIGDTIISYKVFSDEALAACAC